MRRFIVLLVLLASALGIRAEELRFGSFTIQWANGWKRNDATDVIQLVAPAPQRVGVTIDLMDHEAPQDAPFGYAENALPQLASRHGKIVEALKKEALPSGATLFSIVCYDKKRDYFGIIFVHVSPKGRLAQLAIEGQGDPKALVEHYRQLVRSVRWKNEPNQTPEPTATLVTPRAGARVAPSAAVAHL